MAISKEDLHIINSNINKQINKAIKAITEATEEAQAHQRNYYQDTERLLYNYPALRLKLAQDEEDLEKGVLIYSREKSKDIVKFLSFSGGKAPEEIVQEELERSRRASMERTRLEINRIDRALETIKDDMYYDIIPMKYFDESKIESIAEHFGKDESTIKRNKSRLVRKIMVVLFGADAL